MTLAELLYEALTTPLGLIVQSEDAATLRTRLYAERTSLADPALDRLGFTLSPTEPATQLWIVLKPETAANAPQPEV